MPQAAARDSSGLRSPEKFNDLIRQMVESDAFRMAPVMQALLLYLWQNQGRSISEYAIATEALGRAASFDPKADSTVRVQVARLRSKLKEFYEGAGESFPLRLELPRGGHELKWTYQPKIAGVQIERSSQIVSLDSRAGGGSFVGHMRWPAYRDSRFAGVAAAASSVSTQDRRLVNNTLRAALRATHFAREPLSDRPGRLTNKHQSELCYSR